MHLFRFTENKKIVLLIFTLLVIAIYGQSLFGEYVYDDRGIIDHIDVLSSKHELGQVALHPYWEVENGLYRPTTLLSYSFNLIIFGVEPLSFHLINLLLYLFICYFVYLLINRLFNNNLLAFLSGLLFLILPIHTEVVANITGRSELLSLFFALLAMLEATKSKINYWLLGLWVLASIGGKETGIAILPILTIIFYQKNTPLSKEVFLKYFKEISAVAIGALLYFFFRFFSLGIGSFLNIKTSLIENQLLFTDTFSRIATALKILWMYFYKTFWPANLCSDYSYNQIETVSNWLNSPTILGLLLMLTALVLLLINLKKKNPLALGSGIFLFSFLPVSNLFFPIGTIAGERLFFFPSLGIVLVTAYLIYKILYTRKIWLIQIIILLLLILVSIGYITTSHIRQRVWLNETNLFISGAECAPNSALSMSNLGAVYLINDDLDKAEEALKKSMEIKPIYSKGINNLGLVYFRKGDYQKAHDMYIEALSQDFPYPGAWENMVLLYLTEGKIERAKHWLRVMYGPNEQIINVVIDSFQQANKN